MAKKLHPKIQALRSSIGHIPIHRFIPSRKTSSEMLNKTAPQKKSEDTDEIEQYFCVWGIADDYGTRPIKGCFAKSIEERGPESKAPGKIIVLDQHRQHMPVCAPTEIKEDSIGLYGRYTADPIARCKDLVIQIRRGTINNGSYGFQYVWERMEWNEKDDCIDMFESILEELSPVTFGSQRETFVIRNANGLYSLSDEELEHDTEELIKQIPRKYQLQIRGLINRHISLAASSPVEKNQKTTKKRSKSKQADLDYQYLIENLNF